MKILLLLSWSASSVHVASAVARCYFPNGDDVAGDFPCDDNADDSPCCGGGLGSACLSNKLCRGSNGNIVRGSCTDQSWSSSKCAQYCLNAASGGTDLISCSNTTGIGTSYCCDHTVNCCNSGVGRFEVLPAEPDVWATWNRESSRFIVVRQTSSESISSTAIRSPVVSAPSSTISTSKSAGSASTILTPVSSTSTILTSATIEATNGQAQTSTGPIPEPTPTKVNYQNDSGLSTGTKAGIGAGAGFGAVLIMIIAFLLFKVSNNKKIIRDQQEQVRQADHMWPGIHQESVEGFTDKMPSEFLGKYEMEARSAEQHYQRAELPSNS